jgi:pre-mRNA-processing factor 6
MVFIASLNHKTLTLNLNPNTTTLQTLRHHIEQNSLLPISHQRLLISQSLQLSTQNNSTLLTDLQLSTQNNSTLFTTRSDIGPARSNPPPIGAGAGVGREKPKEEDDDENQRFHESEGNDKGCLRRLSTTRRMMRRMPFMRPLMREWIRGEKTGKKLRRKKRKTSSTLPI